MTEKEKLNRRIQSCYISAPIGTNIEKIRTSLLERNVEILFPSYKDIARSPHSNVLDLISSADLVVGVITRKRRSDSVIFELGQAVALGRRVVVFAPPKSGYVPFNLRQFPVVRISLSNRKAMDFAFDQILLAPPSPKKIEKLEVHDTRGMGTRINTYLDRIQKAIATNDGLSFEKVVAQVIQEAGIEIVVEAPLGDRRVDLAVWSDVFQEIFGHPLLIEVKLFLRSEAHVRNTLIQCAENTAKSGAAWSLLLYGDGPTLTEKSSASIAPTVLLISAHELLSKMRNQSFVEIIRNLRNQRVHFGNV